MSNLSLRYTLLSLILLIGLLTTSCATPQNYLDAETPKFTGHFAKTEIVVPSHDTLKVVTFNIKRADKVDRAIEVLQESDNLRHADVLLLQEMDIDGTDRIAKALSYNYVYFPAVLHPWYDQPFGNAILSKWPMSDEEKIILPHKNPLNKQQRAAVAATIAFGDTNVRVYSIHLETILLSDAKRLEQASTIVGHITDQQPDFDHVVVGGDFNAVGAKDNWEIASLFHGASFEWPTEDIGSTSKMFMSLDHIYAKGLQVLDVGKVKNTGASDHFPIWVLLGKDT